MVAKLLLCVALCFTLTQVSLARPDQDYYGYQNEVAAPKKDWNACQESLQKAGEQVKELKKLSESVKFELSEALKRGKECLHNFNFFTCAKNAVKDCATFIKTINFQFVPLLNELIQSVSSALRNCMDQGATLLIKTIVPLGLEYFY